MGYFIDVGSIKSKRSFARIRLELRINAAYRPFDSVPDHQYLVVDLYAHLSKKSLQDASNKVSLIINSAMQVKPKAEGVVVE